MSNQLEQHISTMIEDVIRHRRHLHMHPELSKHEHRTQQYIIDVLDQYNISYQKAASTGVVAHIGSDQPKHCIAIRADIDALPITEANDVPYSSQNEGVMHACGHDAHTSILLGVAMVLSKMTLPKDTAVRLIFQPDEEQSGAAKQIVQEGFLQGCDTVLGLHVMPYLNVGEIEVRDGTLNAESGVIQIDIHGKGAHGAYPQLGVDAIVVASHIVTQLQTTISRMTSPLDQVVLTFGQIQGGNRPNIIADHVQLIGTLRTVNKTTRSTIQTQINKIVKHTCQGFGATATVHHGQGYPMLENTPSINQHIVQNATKMSSISSIHNKEFPSMGAEDFGYYLEQASGAFFHLGCGNKAKGITSGLHTNTFDIDERCLAIGIELQIRNVFSLLGAPDDA